MTVQLLLQLLETVAVVGGVVLGLAQLRHLGRVRERTSAMELLHSFQTPEFAKGLVLIYEMPKGLSKAEVVQRLGDDVHLVYALTTTWESLGILVHRQEIGLDLVADFFSGPIIVSWQKLQKYFYKKSSFDLGARTKDLAHVFPQCALLLEMVLLAGLEVAARDDAHDGGIFDEGYVSKSTVPHQSKGLDRRHFLRHGRRVWRHDVPEFGLGGIHA